MALLGAVAVAMLSMWVGAPEAQAADAEIKIAVLASHPALDAAPLAAMEAAKNDLNAEYALIDTKIVLKVVDVSDYTNSTAMSEKIGAAVDEGFSHFIVPSSSVALAHVYKVIRTVSPDSIMVSPGSAATVLPFFASDDNLFRLSPNHDTRSENISLLFDKYGLDKVVLATYPEAATTRVALTAPEDLHDHFDDPVVPVIAFDSKTPGSYESNVESATALNDRLGAMAQQYGSDRVGVYFGAGISYYADFVKAVADNPQLDNVGNVRWIGASALVGVDQIVTDPTLAEFSARVQLTAIPYVVETDEINAVLNDIQFAPGAQNKNNVYAAYDAIHLLADSISLVGADSPDLKDAVYDVSNGKHALNHTSRITGEGAMGDYVLDPQTGDLVAGGTFIEYAFTQTDDGYGWEVVSDAPADAVADESGVHAPPAQQLRDGVPASMVQCNDPLSLYLRNPTPTDAVPICISEESALVMVERGLNIVSLSDLDGAMSSAAMDQDDAYLLLKAVIDEAIAAYGGGGFDAITQDPGVENYVFVLDRDGTRVARGVDLTPAEANAGQIEWTPSQDKLNAMLAEGDEAWVVYQFPSHTTGELEPKRSLVVLHDGYLFASGYAITHEEYSNELLRYAISDAIALYEENDRDVTSLTRNSTSTSYAFVVDPHELVILAHEQNSLYVGFDVSNVPTTPSTDYLVDALLSQPEPDAPYDPENPEGEIWIVWEFDNPLTGNYDYRHGLVVLHDGLVFVSSHELDEEVYREVAAECTTSCIVGTQV